MPPTEYKKRHLLWDDASNMSTAQPAAIRRSTGNPRRPLALCNDRTAHSPSKHRRCSTFRPGCMAHSADTRTHAPGETRPHADADADANAHPEAGAVTQAQARARAHTDAQAEARAHTHAQARAQAQGGGGDAADHHHRTTSPSCRRAPTSGSACAGEVTPRACPVQALCRRLSPLRLLHIGPRPPPSMTWVPARGGSWPHAGQQGAPHVHGLACTCHNVRQSFIHLNRWALGAPDEMYNQTDCAFLDLPWTVFCRPKQLAFMPQHMPPWASVLWLASSTHSASTTLERGWLRLHFQSPPPLGVRRTHE